MNIAILNFTHIGTLICNLPLIKRIRERYPQAKITLFTCRRNGVINDIISQQYGVRTICLNHDFTGFKRYVSIIQLACKFYKNLISASVDWNREKPTILLLPYFVRKALHIVKIIGIAN